MVEFYCLDVTLTTNILIWTATLFPSIVIIYTFQSWREQKGSEVVANEAKAIYENLRDLLEAHKIIMRSTKYNKDYKDSLDLIEREYLILSKNLNFLESILGKFYDKQNFEIFTNAKNNYLSNLITYKDLNNHVFLYKSNNLEIPQDYPKVDINQVNENYALAQIALNQVLIKILLHSENLET